MAKMPKKDKNAKNSQKDLIETKKQIRFLKQKVRELEYIIKQYLTTRYLAVLDINKQLRIELLTNPFDNRSVLTLNDMQGDARIGLIVLSDGRPAIQLFDEKNRVRAELTLLSDGKPILRFYDIKGKVILEMPKYRQNQKQKSLLGNQQG
jgi:hypothetical protein